MTVASLAGGPVQVAYCVDDVTDAARRWVGRGAGPFYVGHHIDVDDVLIDGRPGVFDHSSAYGQWGAVMVELVAVHEPAGLRRPGLHHQAFFVESLPSAGDELTAAGWPCALSAVAGGTRFAFHDALGDLGHYVEIYERDTRLGAFYDMVRDASDGWDGADPVRVLGGR